MRIILVRLTSSCLWIFVMFPDGSSSGAKMAAKPVSERLSPQSGLQVGPCDAVFYYFFSFILLVRLFPGVVAARIVSYWMQI